MGKTWTFKDIEFLKENYAKMTTEELAEKLGREFRTVRSKAKSLELYKRTNNDEEVVEFKEKFKNEVIQFDSQLLIELNKSDIPPKYQMIYLLIYSIAQNHNDKFQITNKFISEITEEKIPIVKVATKYLATHGYLEAKDIGNRFVFTIKR